MQWVCFPVCTDTIVDRQDFRFDWVKNQRNICETLSRKTLRLSVHWCDTRDWYIKYYPSRCSRLFAFPIPGAVSVRVCQAGCYSQQQNPSHSQPLPSSCLSFLFPVCALIAGAASLIQLHARATVTLSSSCLPRAHSGHVNVAVECCSIRLRGGLLPLPLPLHDIKSCMISYQ